MPFNCAWADEHPRGYVLVGQVFANQTDDVGLLRGEFAAGDRGAFADGPAGGMQFAGGALCECFSADGGEDVVGGAQMVASVDSSVLSAQPFAI